MHHAAQCDHALTGAHANVGRVHSRLEIEFALHVSLQLQILIHGLSLRSVTRADLGSCSLSMVYGCYNGITSSVLICGAWLQQGTAPPYLAKRRLGRPKER